MAAYTGTTPASTTSTRFRSSPKHFLTWSSAANNRIQKMSKHIVSKLQTKMQNHLHNHNHQQNTNEHFQHQHTSSSDSTGGFGRQNEPDCVSPPSMSSSISNISVDHHSASNSCDKGKKSRFSFRNKSNHNHHHTNHNNNNNNSISISNNSLSSSANLIANMSTENILKTNGILINNNSFVHDNNNHHHHPTLSYPNPIDTSAIKKSMAQSSKSSSMSNTNGGNHRAWTSKEVGDLSSYRHRRKSSLVKSLDLDLDVDNVNNMLEMRPVQQFYGGSMNISVLSDSKNSSGNSSGESCRSNNNSSSTSTISTAPTIPIMSPQWSRASSISIPSQCDNHIIQSPPTANNSLLNSDRNSPNGIVGNNSNKNNNNNLNGSSDVMRTSTPIQSSSSSSSPLSEPVTIAMTTTGTTTATTPSNLKSKTLSSISSSHPLNKSTPFLLPPPTSISNGHSNRGAFVMDGNKSQVKKKNSNSFEKNSSTQPNHHHHHHHNHHHHHQQHQHQLKSNATSSNSVATSTLPSKHSVTIFEEEELRNAPWFQQGLPREIALEVLRNEPIGSFIVRESTTHEQCFALSLRVPREFGTGIAHYLILRTGRGYKIKGFTKEFLSLTSLITHHSVMPELLPCPLALYRYKPCTHRVSRLSSVDFMEPEKLLTFQKFTDF